MTTVLAIYGVVGVIAVTIYIGGSLGGANFTFNWRNKRVSDPILILLGLFFLFPFLLAFTIVSIPVHVGLLAFGRKGFWNPISNQYGPSAEGFQKR